MTRLAIVVLPLLTFAGAALAATPPATAPAQQPHTRHIAAHERSANTAEARRETRALNLLEANDDGDFTNFHADGKNFTATVAPHGKPVSVMVDPDSGKITRQG